jgi:hypothetical protein
MTMTTTTTTDRRRTVAIIGTLSILLLLAGSLAVLVYYGFTHMQRPHGQLHVGGVSHLDKVLGIEPLEDITEDGISYVESSRHWGGENFRWTLGHARLVVPLHDKKPQALLVRLGMPFSRTLNVRILLNDKVLFDEKVAMNGEWSRSFDVSDMNLGKEAVIEIISDTYVPADHPNSTDPRTLGVCIRGIVLQSEAPEFVDVPLGAQAVVGVADEGFHGQEQFAGQFFRWTKGVATLDVPIGKRVPTMLDITLEPPTRPVYPIAISVNGHKLFDENIKPNGVWSAQFPLQGIELGKNARLEIKSATFVPAQSGRGSTDGRTLGVRVKRLVLVSDAAK